MYRADSPTPEPLANFQIANLAMRYSLFVPRLYNLCRTLGMQSGKIMASRAFCSDESQGYPIILLAKHFGTFPFNHGQVGGVVATDRHGPHAHHGEDLVLLQASHVGYEAETGTFGTYRRLQTKDQESSTSCGKICGVIDWYRREYEFAKGQVLIHQRDGQGLITIDNQLLNQRREQGLFLRLATLVRHSEDGQPQYVQSLSTSKVFLAAEGLVRELGLERFTTEPRPIGAALTPDLFFFRRNVSTDEEGREHLEQNLMRFMPLIVTAPSPPLTAAQINTQIEFDRTYRTLVKEHAYQGKRLLFVAGLNIDVSPTEGRLFPLTKFVPWAAYVQEQSGNGYTLEQPELMGRLRAQSTENPDQINLEAAIHAMEQVKEVTLKLPR
jgi:hypothetical protein